jgi:hypothetical protein
MSETALQWLQVLTGVVVGLGPLPAPAAGRPDPAMMASASRVAAFIESGGTAPLEGVLADRDVAIIENFAPYLFVGPDAVARWSEGMRAHLVGISSLRHAFGPAFDFSRAGDEAYFSLPTTWRGVVRGKTFTETGGWSFVLVKQAGGWRVRAYGWSVTGLSAK